MLNKILIIADKMSLERNFKKKKKEMTGHKTMTFCVVVGKGKAAIHSTRDWWTLQTF